MNLEGQAALPFCEEWLRAVLMPHHAARFLPVDWLGTGGTRTRGWLAADLPASPFVVVRELPA